MNRRQKAIIFILCFILAFMIVGLIIMWIPYFQTVWESNIQLGKNIIPQSVTPGNLFDETQTNVIQISSSTPLKANEIVEQITADVGSRTPETSAGTTSTPLEMTMLTTTQTPIPSPTKTPTDAWIDQVLSKLSLEERVGQMILVGFQGQIITSNMCQWIKDLSPGGVVYRKGNVDTLEQLKSLSASAQDCAEAGDLLPLLVALDHEGQYVYRFNGGATKFPTAMALGATRDSSWAYQAALYSGQELASSGVNMVLGPVGDVLLDYDNTVISVRSFGGDSQTVSQFIEGAVKGYQESGIISVIKHFPGHGGTPVDSHYAFPVDPATKEQLIKDYLPPFIRGVQAGVPVVMTSHVAFPEIDPNYLPTTMSFETIDILRNEVGFDGVLLSDSMGMGAITQGLGLSIPEASEIAVRAGVDMLLISSYQNALLTKSFLLNEVTEGRLSEDRINQAARRILTLKRSYHLDNFPLSVKNEPVWDKISSAAYDIGYASVTIYRDQSNLIPLSDSISTALVIGPKDYWGMYQKVYDSLQSKNITTDIMKYSLPLSGPVPETYYLNSIPSKVNQYDLVIILTWDAHLSRVRFGDTFQSDLVDALSKKSVPIMIVGLKSPTDILEFPDIPTYLATFGTTTGQIQAFVDTIIGSYDPNGQNPLPGLP